MDARSLEQSFPDILQIFCLEYDYAYHPDYSGRGMYGVHCPGISFQGSELVIGVQLAAFVAEQCPGLDEANDTLTHLAQVVGGACVDSLGLGRILYFPAFIGQDY